MRRTWEMVWVRISSLPCSLPRVWQTKGEPQGLPWHVVLFYPARELPEVVVVVLVVALLTRLAIGDERATMTVTAQREFGCRVQTIQGHILDDGAIRNRQHT